MIELSQILKEILEDIFLNHGEVMLQCIMQNCVAVVDRNKLYISGECIEKLIELIENEKKIILSETQKTELKMLQEYQEEELKIWFAMLMEIDRNKIENMSIFDILRGGKKSIFIGENENKLGVKPKLF